MPLWWIKKFTKILKNIFRTNKSTLKNGRNYYVHDSFDFDFSAS